MSEIGQALSGRPAHTGLPDGLAEGLAWDALLQDSGADVAVVDAQGRVLFMTARPQLWTVPESVGETSGKTLYELFPRELVDERVALIQRVSRDRQALILMEMWRGVRTRTTLRPILVPGNSRPLVMMVCRAVLEFNATEPVVTDLPTVHARVVDLGQLAQLTPRELEVLALIGEGATTQEIAERLCRSAKTVEAHRQALGMKLKAKNRVELSRIAVRADLAAQLRMRQVSTLEAGPDAEPASPARDPLEERRSAQARSQPAPKGQSGH
jgi:DNA-binding CsgD family transcriptional regulator